MIATHLAGVGILLFWLGVAARVRKGRAEDRWRLGPDAPVAAVLPRLTVVVPARDEARVIADCVAALRASDHPDFEVLVFDDGSTDGTAELARASGAEVIVGADAPLPDGWKGKPWALQRATRGLAAEWLLFVDADVRVHPHALSRAHTRAIEAEADLLSGFGHLLMVSFWEKVIQPSVGGLIIAGNDLDGANNPVARDKVIANGQFILVRRAAYEDVGGHGAVRADILDDVGLARAFHDRGHRVRVYFMRELFACRMYTNLRELWDGWTKNLYAGLGYRRRRVVIVASFVAYWFLGPVTMLALGAAHGTPELLGWGVALLALSQAVRHWLDRVFGQDPWFGLLQPLGAAMLVALLVGSMLRSRGGTVVWKGRTYAARPEDARPPEAAA